MCDISTETTFKQKTVYKTAMKLRGEYYSIFAMHHLVIGKVADNRKEMGEMVNKIFSHTPSCLLRYSDIFNENMLGKISGFDKLSDAITLSSGAGLVADVTRYSSSKVVILKIILGGEIMKGTTHSIMGAIPWDHITYAGSRIISMTEVEI